MKSLYLIFIAVFFTSTLTAEEDGSKSIVRVNATLQAYDFYQPWEKKAPSTKRGLGAIISGDRVIVTAELVANATYIELEKPESGVKASASVKAVDYEANLAILEPQENQKDFLADRVPLEISTDVTVGDPLDVLQIERNGTPVVTSGKVSAIEVGPYFTDGSYMLTYRLKGSLQYISGSFTLPVVHDGKLAGMLLSYSSKEQISAILAGPILEHFLNDIDDGTYEGFATLGIRYSQTLDEQFRDYLKLEGEGGVFVTGVSPKSSAEVAGLKKGDVIVSIDGHPIDSRGNYNHPKFGILSLSHITKAKYIGDPVNIRIVRDGEPMKITAMLTRKKSEDYIIDPYMYDRGPRFLISGGLVFQELSRPYLKMFGENWETRAPFKLLYAESHPEKLEEEGLQKLVFLSRVIRTPATLGYESLAHITVTKVNDQKITNIKDLDAAFASKTNGYHKIEFEEYPKVIYTDALETEAINDKMKQIFRIPELKRLD